jgi:mRNA interferase RelE/StbE
VLYRIEITYAARRQMAALQKDVMRRVDEHILALASNPRPFGAEKMSGEQNQYRIRVGAYRIIYEIHDERLVVLVVRIGHRREVYRWH